MGSFSSWDSWCDAGAGRANAEQFNIIWSCLFPGFGVLWLLVGTFDFGGSHTRAHRQWMVISWRLRDRSQWECESPAPERWIRACLRHNLCSRAACGSRLQFPSPRLPWYHTRLGFIHFPVLLSLCPHWFLGKISEINHLYRKPGIMGYSRANDLRWPPSLGNPPETPSDIGSPSKSSYSILMLSRLCSFVLAWVSEVHARPQVPECRDLSWLTCKSMWDLVCIHQTLIVKAKLTQRFVNRLWVLGYRLNCCNQSLNNIAFNRIHFHFSFMQ